MKTLKDHQDTMVSMLASDTAIPTSAIRLAHALHDVLAHLNNANVAPVAHTERRIDATTPGLNDVMLAQDLAAVKPKQQSLESLLKQRDNTIRQLKGRVADLVAERDEARHWLQLSLAEIRSMRNPEQAGCRKEDTQVDDGCPHPWTMDHFELGGEVVQEICGCCGAIQRVRLTSEDQP